MADARLDPENQPLLENFDYTRSTASDFSHDSYVLAVYDAETWAQAYGNACYEAGLEAGRVAPPPPVTAPAATRLIDFAPPEVTDKLIKLQVGGCTCMTKTPELRFHDERCTYRLAVEVQDLLNTAAPPSPPVATSAEPEDDWLDQTRQAMGVDDLTQPRSARPLIAPDERGRKRLTQAGHDALRTAQLLGVEIVSRGRFMMHMQVPGESWVRGYWSDDALAPDGYPVLPPPYRRGTPEATDRGVHYEAVPATYTADHMRAFVDKDRAARARPPLTPEQIDSAITVCAKHGNALEKNESIQWMSRAEAVALCRHIWGLAS